LSSKQEPAKRHQSKNRISKGIKRKKDSAKQLLAHTKVTESLNFTNIKANIQCGIQFKLLLLF